MSAGPDRPAARHCCDATLLTQVGSIFHHDGQPPTSRADGTTPHLRMQTAEVTVRCNIATRVHDFDDALKRPARCDNAKLVPRPKQASRLGGRAQHRRGEVVGLRPKLACESASQSKLVWPAAANKKHTKCGCSILVLVRDSSHQAWHSPSQIQV